MGQNSNAFIPQKDLSKDQLLHRIINRIRQSLELEEILEQTVSEIRSFLGTDRVKVYRFHPDGSGEVIAESVNLDRLPSLLGLNFPADDIPPHAREQFITVRRRSIVNLQTQDITLSQLQDTIDGHVLPHDEVFQRPVDPCHAEYLKAMGVMFSVVVPIVHDERLWGLLVAHHSEPRDVNDEELQLIQMVADQVAVAIAQSTLLLQTREQVRRETIINRIASRFHTQPEIQFQTALEETVAIFQGCGGRLYLRPVLVGQSGILYTSGKQPPTADLTIPIEQQAAWQLFFSQGDGDTHRSSIQVITDLYQMPELKDLADCFRATPIRGMVVVPLLYRHQFMGYLSIFRQAVDTERRWAGMVDLDHRQLQPRKSFEAWLESKQGQAPTWSGEEIELAMALGEQFATAIQQYQLYQQVRILNADLEELVDQRTLALRQSTEQQRALTQIIGKIHASPDLDMIFQTTASEIRRLLGADRVGIFRFDPESEYKDGEFVAEDVLPEYSSALSTKVHDYCFGEKYATHYQQGRIQVVHDIYSAGLSECHIDVLSCFHVRANLVVPLVRGGVLWGLLCIHQCSEARRWESAEIEFVRQIAAQLAIALQQAELLAQTRQQTEQLAEMLHDLQQAQTQLIQTEKMSSLGQLVAGVAHEINNPVNFIYGNLNHAEAYTQDLLDLLQLVQQQCDDPLVIQKADEIDLEFVRVDLPKLLVSMKTGADRIRQIVLSLRNFSRLDQSNRKAVDLHEGIDSTLMILQHRLKPAGDAPGIEVIRAYGELPPVECYAGQLNQVFMNVISNAIDALEEKQVEGTSVMPTLTIQTCLLDNHHVQIRIADNGPGIPETIRSRIFDPFFTTKAVGKGTGLGLSISYQVVTERHGGVMRCTSTPGQGTEFVIELPI